MKSNKILAECTDSTLQEVTLLVGCFHTVMNILGCVGYLMEASGLNDILGEIYGDNAVIHMLSGIAYSRALRGHLIIDQASSKFIIKKLNDDSFISELEPLYNDATEGKKETSEIEGNNILHEISARIQETKKTLASESRTSKLWLGYRRIIDIIRKYILKPFKNHFQFLLLLVISIT